MAVGDFNDMLGRLVGALPGGWFPRVGNYVTDGKGNPVPDGYGGYLTDGTPGPTIVTSVLAAFSQLQAYIYSLLAYVKLQTRIKTATDGWLDLIAYDFFGLTVQRASGQSDASFRLTIIANIFQARNTRAAVINVLTNLTGYAPIVFNPWKDEAYLNSTAYIGRFNWGSRGCPFQSFVIAYRGNGATDAQIYAAVAATQSAGVTLWTQIQDYP